MTTKEVILLSILNEILVKQNKPEINNIKDFSIEKEDLTKENNYPIIESKYKLIFEHYKKDSSHYRRGSIKNYIIVLIRRMCKELGLKWDFVKIDRGVIIDGKKFRIKTVKYTIN